MSCSYNVYVFITKTWTYCFLNDVFDYNCGCVNEIYRIIVKYLDFHYAKCTNKLKYKPQNLHKWYCNTDGQLQSL